MAAPGPSALHMSTPDDSNVYTLPPELLSLIFNHAVRDTVLQERSLVALALTHVCRSFRYVALDSPWLWTSLYRNMGHPKLAFIEACIERSGNEPLDVSIQFFNAGRPIVPAPEAIMVDSVIKQVLPHCARWRSCVWDIILGPCEEDFISYFDIHTSFDKIHAPILDELSITSGGHLIGILQYFRSKIRWVAPNLHTFTVTNFTTNTIPLVFRGQLHSVTINFRQANLCHHFTTLRRLTTMATTLTTLRLSLIDCCFARESSLRSVEFSVVNSVCIELLSCKQTFPRPHLLWHEFRTFYFPRAVAMSIAISCGDEDQNMLWKEYTILLYSLLGPDLVHPQRYPSLQTLDVTIHSELQYHDEWMSRFPASVIIFPTCCVPSVKHLRIRSTCYWVLLDNVTVAAEYDPTQPPCLATRGEIVPIALETVSLDLPRLEGVVTWIKRLVSNMQDSGCWDNFECLNIIRDGDVEVILRDAVEGWCGDCINCGE